MQNPQIFSIRHSQTPKKTKHLPMDPHFTWLIVPRKRLGIEPKHLPPPAETKGMVEVEKLWDHSPFMLQGSDMVLIRLPVPTSVPE